MTAVMSFIYDTSLLCSWLRLITDRNGLLDAERQRPLARLAAETVVERIADGQVVAENCGDRQVDTVVFHAVGVAELEVVAIEVVAEAAELVVRALLGRQ